MNNTKKILERLKKKMGSLPYEDEQLFKRYQKYIELIDKEIMNLLVEEESSDSIKEELIKYIERYKSLININSPDYHEAIKDIMTLIKMYFKASMLKMDQLNFSVKSDENNNKDGRIELKNDDNSNEWILTIPKGKVLYILKSYRL